MATSLSFNFLKACFHFCPICMLNAAVYTWIWDSTCFLLLVVTCIEPLSTLCVGVLTVECFKHCDVQAQGQQTWHFYAETSGCIWLHNFIRNLTWIDCFMLCQLNLLVTKKYVDGWDDPRLMTLAGLRRRGVTSTSINAFVRGIGISRRLNFTYSVHMSRYCRLSYLLCFDFLTICHIMWYSDCTLIRLDRLEYHIREELNKTAPRTMVVLNPLKVCILSLLFPWEHLVPVFKWYSLCFQVVITNMESGSIMHLDAKRWPDAQADDASAFYKVIIE